MHIYIFSHILYKLLNSSIAGFVNHTVYFFAVSLNRARSAMWEDLSPVRATLICLSWSENYYHCVLRYQNTQMIFAKVFYFHWNEQIKLVAELNVFCGTCILYRLLPIIKIKPLNADFVKKKKTEIGMRKQIQNENEVKREGRIDHLFTKCFTKDATILTSLLKIV